MNWYLNTFVKLNQAKIPYAVVGGLAVALHGAQRGTIDLDLIISLDLESFKKFELCMKELGLLSRIPVTSKEVFEFRKEYIKNRNLIAWSFYDPKQAHHVVDLIITHDFRKMKKISKQISGVSVPILAIPDLIKMKKASGRPQDLQDIEALTEIDKSK